MTEEREKKSERTPVPRKVALPVQLRPNVVVYDVQPFAPSLRVCCLFLDNSKWGIPG
jgi:hypothetical protein